MSVRAQAGLGLAAARIVGHWAREQVGPKRAARPGEVPPTPDRLSNAWLTDALCTGHPDAHVVSYAVGGGSDGTSARRQLTVGYDDAGRAAGLPTALYTKSCPSLGTRIFCGLSDLMVNETEFYLRIRPELDIETPLAYAGAFDRRSGCCLLVLEDIATTRGATFADPTVTTVDRANAERMVGIMAAYHGALWHDPRLDREFDWLVHSADFQDRLVETLRIDRMFRNGIDRSRHVMPAAVGARSGELWDALMASVRLRRSMPQTLVHQDVHSRNWYFTGEGHIGIYDWQAAGKGPWAVDVAYALSCGLTPENRRAWERDLIAIYLDRLAAAGGKAPSFDEAWLAYRQQMMHGLGYWLATIGVMKFQPELQPRAVCLANIERMSIAVEELDSLDALSRA